MRLVVWPESTRVGNVEIHGTFCVTELDAGGIDGPRDGSEVCNNKHSEPKARDRDGVFSPRDLRAIETQLAIVVPCMNEEKHLLEGVLRGIPNQCLIILVSNSKACNFLGEQQVLSRVCHENKRRGIVVHQQGDKLADAFNAAGMSQILKEPCQNESSLKHVREGKGEAMMIGVALAKLSGKQFVGFIDADNWVPGSVQEYCKVFAAGLHYAHHRIGNEGAAPTLTTTQPTQKPYAIVRIKWNQKPKVEDGKLVSKDSGRCSIVVNRWMNRLLNVISNNSIRNELIQTANAGEHAMSIDLALKLHFATGYAVEPFQIIDALEQFGQQDCVAHPLPDTKSIQKTHIARTSSAPALRTVQPRPRTNSTQTATEPSAPDVRIIQIKTCNPHIHDFSKGDKHIKSMQVQGLSTIYHSLLTPRKLKDELRLYMKENFPETLGVNGEQNQTTFYPPLESMDWDIFQSILESGDEIMEVFGAT